MKNFQQGFISIVIIAVLAIALAGAGYFTYKNSQKTEALAPNDGSPTSINVDSFQALPAPTSQMEDGMVADEMKDPPAQAGWKTYKNDQYGFEFRYPEKLPTRYIVAHVWPPSVQVKTGVFSCNEAGFQEPGKPIVRKTKITPAFCVVTQGDAAAGSSYAMYDFTTTYNDKLITFSFTLRQPNNCGPITGPQRPECLEEERSFSPDNLVAKIFSTFRFTK